MDTFPCHITVPHPPHDWMPLVADPENDHVLHLGLAEVPCPGIERDWSEESHA